MAALHTSFHVNAAITAQWRYCQVLEALHAVYEDFKLHLLRWPHLRELGRLLAALAVLLRAPLYVDHYLRDQGPACLPSDAAALLARSAAPGGVTDVSLAQPANMHRALLRMLKRPQARFVIQ